MGPVAFVKSLLSNRKLDIETSNELSVSRFHISDVRETLISSFGNSSDLVVRDFLIRGSNVRALLSYIDGLVDNELLNANILRPLMISSELASSEIDSSPLTIIGNSITTSSIEEKLTWADIIQSIADGRIVLFVDECPSALVIQLPGFEHRPVGPSKNENIVLGPQESFVEALRTNTSLIRRYLRTSKLRILQLKIGTISKSDVAVMYLEGVVNPDILNELMLRINSVNTDKLIDSSQLEHLIQDNNWSPFPQIVEAQRPDEVSMNIAEGRIALIIDHSPYALILPVTLRNFLISSEDYYHRWIVATSLRLLRGFAIINAILLPALYVALTSFHPELLPTQLMISIGTSRLNVPFPAVAEAILMSIALELLTEAGLRLPGILGQTVGVVGGLIIGQAAVNAGLVSSGMVVVVALTAIGTFTVPKYNFAFALRIIRIPLIFAASFLGLFGVIWGSIIILIHLSSLESFGIPYTTPLSPLIATDLNDDILRTPIDYLDRRSSSAVPADSVRDVDSSKGSDTN